MTAPRPLPPLPLRDMGAGVDPTPAIPHEFSRMAALHYDECVLLLRVVGCLPGGSCHVLVVLRARAGIAQPLTEAEAHRYN